MWARAMTGEAAHLVPRSRGVRLDLWAAARAAAQPPDEYARARRRESGNGDKLISGVQTMVKAVPVVAKNLRVFLWFVKLVVDLRLFC